MDRFVIQNDELVDQETGEVLAGPGDYLHEIMLSALNYIDKHYVRKLNLDDVTEEGITTSFPDE